MSYTSSYQFVESSPPHNSPILLKGPNMRKLINQVSDCLCEYTPGAVNSHKVLAIKDAVNLNWSGLDEDQG